MLVKRLAKDGALLSSLAKVRGARKMSRVAALIIASEVLNGGTLDTNSQSLARKCFQVGLSLEHIRTIPDNVETIAAHVRELSSQYDFLFTSGGIGPTHDDMTYEAISTAFGRKLAHHAPTIRLMEEHFGGPCTEGQRRMALLPEAARVSFAPNLWVPLVQVANVLVLPGVPVLFNRLLGHWIEAEVASNAIPLRKSPRTRMLVKTLSKESAIAAPLAALQEACAASEIQIGSYPKLLDDGSSHVVISLVGPQEAHAAMGELVETLKRHEAIRAVPCEE